MQNVTQDSTEYNTKFNKVAGLYNIGKTIGKGHFAVVKEACHVITQEKVAIKIIDKTKLDENAKDQLLLEVMCMKLVQHPNIIRLYEVIDTVTKLYLIVELGDGGDLYDYITNQGPNGLCEDEAKRYFRQILRAIGYCHKLHVVHRDLKPENVVFFNEFEVVKLTDFGFSNKFVPGRMLNTSCGSLAYSAPEILLGDSYDAPMVDIWSLGVILFMLVAGTLPFNETNDSETISKIMDCTYAIPSFVSDGAKNLIRKMIVRDAKDRAILDEICNDSWLQVDENDAEYELESYRVPWIDREQLTFEEHLEIITKMSDENLASLDEIQRIIDANEYNYISATYFLLAERKVKRRFIEEYLKLKSKITNENREKNTTKASEVEPCATTTQTNVGGMRRISMILEDEEDEENEAISSLAYVRRELESFKSENEPNSRCLSRINSDCDLQSLLDDYEYETRLKLRSPIASRQKSVSNNQIPNLKKSRSASDLSFNSTGLENMKNTVHMFSIGPNTVRFSSNSAKYLEMRKMSMGERLSNQIFFGTGLRSNTVSYTSPDNSDTESEAKMKKKNSIKNVEKQISELCDFRDIFQPIDEENELMKSPGNIMSPLPNTDYYRSQSFDGRLRNTIHLDSVSARGVLPLRLKSKSPTNSWHRNSLCHHLADSNFSLISWASKSDNPNMMQVIRGSIGLHLHNRASVSDCISLNPLVSEVKPINSPLHFTPTHTNKRSHLFISRLRPHSISNYFHSTFPKFKKRNPHKSLPSDQTVNNSSGTCHTLSPTKEPQTLSPNNLFIKKHNQECCHVS